MRMVYSVESVYVKGGRGGCGCGCGGFSSSLYPWGVWGFWRLLLPSSSKTHVWIFFHEFRNAIGDLPASCMLFYHRLLNLYEYDGLWILQGFYEMYLSRRKWCITWRLEWLNRVCAG